MFISNTDYMFTDQNVCKQKIKNKQTNEVSTKAFLTFWIGFGAHNSHPVPSNNEHIMIQTGREWERLLCK